MEGEFHAPHLLLEFGHRPWERVTSLGGLVNLLNSLHPPTANGWMIESSSELSPIGIPWNECPAKGTRLGTFASTTI